MTSDVVRFEPAASAERVIALDALRGFALFGILCVNLLIFNYPVFFAAPLSTTGVSGVDRVVEWATRVFAEGSFYPIFSFLFGLGFALMLRKGSAFLPTFRRRLAILLVIGLIHLVFIWFGDILVAYALLGYVLLLFRKRSARTISVWIVALTLVTFLMQIVIFSSGGEAMDPEFSRYVTAQFASYGTTILANLAFMLFALVILLVQGGQILSLFLLGFLAGRAGLAELQPSHLPLLRRTFILTASLGLPLTLFYGVLLWRGTVPPLLAAVDVTFGSALLGLSYLSGLALLYLRSRRAFLWTPLAAVGRMSLSNYLTQSVVMTLLFYPYGLGLAQRVGPATALLLALLLFTLQAVVSIVWLRYFRYGPVEWLWRSLTYKSLLPLRK